MGNGENQEVQFTRGDAERLKTIEINQNDMHEKLDAFINKINSYMDLHNTRHLLLNDHINKNVRFRKGFIKVLLWLTSSAGLAAIIFVIQSLGWLG